MGGTPAKQAENFKKGRMAESLVEELLRKAGNSVYRFGYGRILDHTFIQNKFIHGVTPNTAGACLWE